jgi:hypothetical protein
VERVGEVLVGEDLPPAAAFLQEKGEDLRRVIDEMQSRAEGATASEDVE